MAEEHTDPPVTWRQIDAALALLLALMALAILVVWLAR